MNFLKSKQLTLFLALTVIVFTFTQCKNKTKGVKEDAKKIETKTKNEISKIENETKTSLAKDKMYFYYKTEHAKTLIDLEKIKAHFILKTDKFKLESELNKLEKRLSALEKSADTDSQKFIAKIKTDIEATKQSIKNDDKTAKIKLDKLSNDFSSEISRLESKISSEEKNISEDAKRHYAELKAKEYLLKARLASYKMDTYAKANNYLDKAYQEYAKAKQYGNEKYKATIEDLLKDIKSVKKNIQSKDKNVKKEINHIIMKLSKNLK